MWSSKHLSFAARCQLVKSVLMSIHVYWGQIFILPKGVIEDINFVCRCFLWTGIYNDSKPAAVGWEHCASLKRLGEWDSEI